MRSVYDCNKKGGRCRYLMLCVLFREAEGRSQRNCWGVKLRSEEVYVL